MNRLRLATASPVVALLVAAACSSGNIGGTTTPSPDASAATMTPSPDGSTPTGMTGTDGGPATIVDAQVPLEATAPTMACANDAGKASTYNAIGSGTAADPYVLCNPAQVVALSGTPAAWKFAFSLGADVDLAANGPSSASPFKTIGTTMQPFTGTFDGGGHIVSNAQVSTPNVDDVGFFGVVQGAAAEVRSLNITGASMSGQNDVGLLTGSLNRGARILGCSSQGTAQSLTRAGGLVGNGLNAPIISSSWSSATVTVSMFFAGGLVGLISQGAFIYNSYAAGAVNGLHNIGGLLGGADSGAVYSSYSTATVTSTDAVGGAVGGLAGNVNGTIYQNCFATGDVVGNGSSTTVGRLFGDPEYGTFTNNFDLSTSKCQVSSGKSCPADAQGETLAQLQDKTRLPLSAWDFTTTWTGSGANPTLHSTLFDARSWDGCGAHMTDSPLAGGDGTPDRPYLVCSAGQFTNLASTQKLRTGVYVLQMASIDLSAAGTLQPIGTSDAPFIGVYNGNGKSLSNFTVNGSGGDVGLFGNVTGAIARVAAVNGTVTASSSNNAGILVAACYGIVHDSYATGKVTGSTAVGGLGNPHTMLGCYASATVTANSGMGSGLSAAGGNDGSVADSFASSTVTAPSGNAYTVSPPVNSSAQVANTFFDSSKCSGCTNVDAMGETTSYFYSATNAPLKSWDFDTIWMAQPNGFPTLR
jgi:hypothetical protein